MKKFCLFFLSAFLSALTAQAWTPCGTDAKGNEANCEYQIIDGTLTIRGTNGIGNIGTWHDGANLSPPWSGKGVKNIVFEDTIKDLGSRGFYLVTSQNPIEIPSSVTSIHSNAFDGVKASQIIIPDSVTSIGSGAFFHSFNLQSLVVPDSVETIGSNAFNMVHTENLDIFINDHVVLEGNVFDTDGSIRNIYCSGNINVCKQNVGENMADKVIATTSKKINGMTYILDGNGKIIATSGKRANKRIYTVEEASLVAGKKNKLMIKYK